MCFQFYEGKGYSRDFTDHMGRIIKEMEADPSQIVRLMVTTDMVCASCPNKEGKSCTTQDKVVAYDEAVLKACEILEGSELPYKEFIATVKEKIICAGLRSEICGDCSWDYICREKEAAQLREAIARITEMEEALDRVLAALDDAELSDVAASAGSSAELEADVRRLAEYYDGPDWKEDFVLDEAGILPKDLKRGVLSEDGIYDALEKYKEIF